MMHVTNPIAELKYSKWPGTGQPTCQEQQAPSAATLPDLSPRIDTAAALYIRHAGPCRHCCQRTATDVELASSHRKQDRSLQ